MSEQPSRTIIYGAEAQDKLLNGVKTLYEAVKTTLGPKGRNALIEQHRGSLPHITKDGVTVAANIYLDDKLENLGAQTVSSVSKKTASDAGDGTTTATVLAYEIFKEGLSFVKQGQNPMFLKEELINTSKTVVKYLSGISNQISNKDQLKNIATISANGDTELGDLTSEAVYSVGESGDVIVEPSDTSVTTLEIQKGFRIDAGLVSPYFITTTSKASAEFSDARVLLINAKVDNLTPILKPLEQGLKDQVPIVIVAQEFNDALIKMFIDNKLKNGLKIACVKLPFVGEERSDLLDDLAVALNTKVFLANEEQIEFDQLGYSDTFVSNKVRTSFSIKNSESVSTRINTLNGQLDAETQTESKDYIKKRISRLNGNIAVIKVGGSTSTEVKERKDRIDDAIGATKAALAEGFVAGGGLALYHASLNIEEKTNGDVVLKRAIQMPLKTILDNAGYSFDSVQKQYSSSNINQGLDIRTGETVDMLAKGITDPVKVTRVAVENAVSVASLLLTTGVLIGINREENQE